MKIGIDAKWFYDGPPSGRVVVRNLVKYLIENNKKHEFFIFLDRRFKSLKFPYMSGNVHLVYLWAGINLVSNVLFVPWVGRKLGLDVFVAQYWSPFFSRFIRVTYIHDVIFETSPEYFTWKERLYFLPTRSLARRAHHICTVSESEKQRLLRLHYSVSEKISVIYNGVDLNRFKQRSEQGPKLLLKAVEKLRLPSEFLLYVGRLNMRKNLDNLLKAISLLKHTPIPLVLAGEADRKAFDPSKALKQFGLENRLIVTGYVQDDLLPALYSLAKVFCYVSCDEGFGLPPLEAMASGVPVVVANVGSILEVCGEAGNYVDPTNPTQIASMIEMLLTDELLYQNKKVIGLERVKHFSWGSSVQALLARIECWQF